MQSIGREDPRCRPGGPTCLALGRDDVGEPDFQPCAEERGFFADALAERWGLSAGSDALHLGVGHGRAFVEVLEAVRALVGVVLRVLELGPVIAAAEAHAA